jgi:hypothetical protein
MKKSYRSVARRFTALLAIASLAALLFVAAPASAQTATQQGYTTSARVQQTVDPKSTTSNKLPFTGLDVVAMLAVGGALLAVGFGVRKVASSSTLA